MSFDENHSPSKGLPRGSSPSIGLLQRVHNERASFVRDGVHPADRRGSTGERTDGNAATLAHRDAGGTDSSVDPKAGPAARKPEQVHQGPEGSTAASWRAGGQALLGILGGGGGGGGGGDRGSMNKKTDDRTACTASPDAQGRYPVEDEETARPVLDRGFDELTLRQLVVRKHIHTASLSVLAITAIGFLLVQLRPVLLPFVLAIMLTYTLTPMIDILTAKPKNKGGFRKHPPSGVTYAQQPGGAILVIKRPQHSPNIAIQLLQLLRAFRLPRGLAIIGALIIAALITTGVGAIIASSITDLSQNMDKYRGRVQQTVDIIMLWTNLLNIDVTTNNLPQQIQQQIMTNHGIVSPVSDFFFRTVSIVFDELSNGFLMLLFTVYLLLGYQPHRKMTGIRAEIDKQVKRYIGCKVLLSASTGTMVGIILTLLGVDLALVFGLLTFLLNFIPNVGSVIAMLLPMPVVIFDPSKTWFDVTLTAIIPSTVQMVMGNVIEPRVLGRTMELHPITVLLALMLWGSLWGVVGMILSVPMSAVLKICLASLDHPFTKFCARLMEGKSSPAEDGLDMRPGRLVNTPRNTRVGHRDVESAHQRQTSRNEPLEYEDSDMEEEMALIQA